MAPTRGCQLTGTASRRARIGLHRRAQRSAVSAPYIAIFSSAVRRSYREYLVGRRRSRADTRTGRRRSRPRCSPCSERRASVATSTGVWRAAREYRRSHLEPGRGEQMLGAGGFAVAGPGAPRFCFWWGCPDPWWYAPIFGSGASWCGTSGTRRRSQCCHESMQAMRTTNGGPRRDLRLELLDAAIG